MSATVNLATQALVQETGKGKFSEEEYANI